MIDPHHPAVDAALKVHMSQALGITTGRAKIVAILNAAIPHLNDPHHKETSDDLA